MSHLGFALPVVLVFALFAALIFKARARAEENRDESDETTRAAEGGLDALFSPLGLAKVSRAASFSGPDMTNSLSSSSVKLVYSGSVDGFLVEARCGETRMTGGSALRELRLALKRPSPGRERFFAIARRGAFDVPLDQLWRLLPPLSLKEGRLLAFGRPVKEVTAAVFSAGVPELLDLLRATSIGHALATLSVEESEIVFTPQALTSAEQASRAVAYMARLARALAQG